MTEIRRKLTVATPEEMAGLAERLGRQLRPGDCVLLKGQIGAGKTHLARSLIQSLQDVPEDVPSPTFTLIQVYDTRAGELWHTDLYRLTSVDEVEELGLADAFDNAICLVEWPEKLGDLRPRDALTLTIDVDTGSHDTRHVTFLASAGKWISVLDALLETSNAND